MQKNSSFSIANLIGIIALVVFQFSSGCRQSSTISEGTVSQTRKPYIAPQIPMIDTNSITPVEPSTPTSPVNNEPQNSTLQPYIDELADHRLMDFSRYNSGSNGEGMRTEEWLDLCSGGNFFSHSSSTISIGGEITQDNKDDQGTWWVYNNNDVVMIRFKFSTGDEKEVPVTVEDGKLYMNGKRYYHIAKGENYGPQSCN